MRFQFLLDGSLCFRKGRLVMLFFLESGLDGATLSLELSDASLQVLDGLGHESGLRFLADGVVELDHVVVAVEYWVGETQLLHGSGCRAIG
jgi:hypothetical protein